MRCSRPTSPSNRSKINRPAAGSYRRDKTKSGRWVFSGKNALWAEAATKLAAAEEKERQIRLSLNIQRGQALDLSPAASEYGKLEGELAQMQKQSELLDARIAEVSVNRMESRPLNIRVVE